MKSGTHDFTVTLASRIVTLCLGIGVQSCLAWFLGPSGRGSYAVCLVFAALLSIVFVVGSDIATLYFVSVNRFSVSEGIVYALIYGGIGSGMAIVAGLILMQFPLPFFDNATPAAFHLALVSIPVSLLAYTFLLLLTSVHQFSWFAIMSVLHGSAILLFTVIFVRVFSWGVNGALLAILTAGMAIIAGTLLFFRWKYSITWVKPSLKSLLEMLHYGARYYMGKIGNTVNLQIGTVILAFFVTKEEVGLFAVASQVAVKTMIIPDALITVLIPKVSGDEEGKKELVAQCFRLTSLACGILLLILAVFAKPVVAVLFSPAFLPAVPLIQILAIGVFIRSACKVFVPYFLGTDHPGVSSTSVVLATIVNLVTLWVLLPIMGLPGAAIGMVAGFFASSIFLTMCFLRFSGLGLQETWQLKRSDLAMVGSAMKQFAMTIFG